MGEKDKDKVNRGIGKVKKELGGVKKHTEEGARAFDIH
jgi:hypothetical protein